MQELYFDRQPSSKAESMGGGLSAYTENEFGSYYNPALTSLSNGLVVNTSFSNNYRSNEKGGFKYLGATYKIKNIVTIGFSRYDFYYGDDYYASNGMEAMFVDLHNTITALNISKEIFKDFYAGVNLEIIKANEIFFYFPKIGERNLYPIDIGILKKFNLPNKSSNITQSIQVGSSLYNLNNVEYDYDYYLSFINVFGTHHILLPVTFRLGASYNLKFKENRILKDFNIINFLAHAEMEKVLNSNLYTRLKFGCELTLLDILSLRAGYYFGNTYVYKLASDYTPLTYGIGLNIPFNSLFNMSSTISISIDYVHLNQPPEWDLWHENLYTYDYFKTLSANLRWVPHF